MVPKSGYSHEERAIIADTRTFGGSDTDRGFCGCFFCPAPLGHERTTLQGTAEPQGPIVNLFTFAAK